MRIYTVTYAEWTQSSSVIGIVQVFSSRGSVFSIQSDEG